MPNENAMTSMSGRIAHAAVQAQKYAGGFPRHHRAAAVAASA
jgi:hypothetical protein